MVAVRRTRRETLDIVSLLQICGFRSALLIDGLTGARTVHHRWEDGQQQRDELNLRIDEFADLTNLRLVKWRIWT
jgi:hypothetical protein